MSQTPHCRFHASACFVGLHFVAAVLLCDATALAARWSLTPRSTIALDANGFSVGELSGIAYRGRVAGPVDGVCTSCGFVAVQDSSAAVVALNLSFDAAGAILSATAVGTTSLAANLDYEGIAVTSQFETAGGNAASVNRFLVSNEATPGVLDVNVVTGATNATVPIPAVYANIRSNRGFESLATWTRSNDGFRMAVANEEALTIDGPAAGLANGTTVRIQTYNVLGNPAFTLTYQPTAQFAYNVDPIHGGTGTNSLTRSGLVDLAAMPDGTLIALERSFANNFTFQNRIYEIDPSVATDVGGLGFESGLAGKSFTPANKELLWSGSVGGVFGANLEGLTLGPQLANGNWLLVGVVDDDGLTAPTLVSYEAAPIISADFNASGLVEGADFLAWQRDNPTIPPFLADQRIGDANRDGAVDAADLAVWQTQYGTAGLSAVSFAVPEPHCGGLAFLAGASWAARRGRRPAWRRIANHA